MGGFIMGNKTWYRGVSGRAAAKDGAYAHPLGDGTYFTDNEDVAWEYAATKWDRRTKNSDSKALDKSKQQVYEVQASRRSLGRVLDLTTDPRWRKFIRQKIGRRTIESMISRNTELFGRFFLAFLSEYKLKLESFDAIIGKDYESGGKLLCLRKGSRLASRLTRIMKPLSFRIRRVRAINKLTSFVGLGSAGKRTKVIPFRPSKVASKSVRTVSARTRGSRKPTGVSTSGLVGAVIAHFVVHAIWPWLAKKFGATAEKWLEKDFEKLKPSIDKDIQAQSLWAMHLKHQGSDPYANLTFTLETRHVQRDSYGPYLKPKEVEVKVTANDTNSSKDISKEKSVSSVATQSSLTHELVTTSAKIVFPESALSLYNTALDELEWYQGVFSRADNRQAEYGQSYGGLTRTELERLVEERDLIIADLATLGKVSKEKARAHVKGLSLL
jgi:hypothetical protein